MGAPHHELVFVRDELYNPNHFFGEQRVSSNCGCDESTSCYGCLRSYRNQFAHQYLQRGPVVHYLEVLLSKWQ